MADNYGRQELLPDVGGGGKYIIRRSIEVSPGVFADAFVLIGADGATPASVSNPLPVGAGGGFAGCVASASFTPVAEAYSAGDTIATAQEFAFTFANGVAVPSGSLIRILTSLVKIDATAVISGETSYNLPLYTVTPPSALANNAAWTLASADLPSHEGILPLGTPTDQGAALFVRAQYQDFDVKLTGTSLFGFLQTVGGFNAAAVARQVFLRGVVL